MKQLLSFVLAIVLLGCGKTNISFQSVEIVPTQNMKLHLDRLILLESSKEKKERLKKELNEITFEQDSTRSVYVHKGKLPQFKDFITKNYEGLFLSPTDQPDYLSLGDTIVPLCYDSRNQINLNPFIKSTSSDENTYIITLNSKGVETIKNFSLKYFQQQFAIKVDGELLSVVRSFGKLEEGKLIVPVNH